MTGQIGHAGALGVPAADPVSPLPAGSRLVVALAGLLAVVLLLAGGVVALRASTANADTRLTSGADALLALPDGSTRPAVVGERVPSGATVLAGATGAVLQTRDRRVYLGRDTSVTVQDGARQVLGRGFVLVDATDGPGVELATAAGVVTTADSSLVRVDDGMLLRVGVLGGQPASVRATGRRAAVDVPRYYQVQLALGGLPTEPTPLLLTGDAYERDLARALHDADRDLNDVAGRLDAAGQAGPLVLSVLQTAVPAGMAQDSPVAVGTPGSERALSFLLASAVQGGSLGARYERVRALRTAGGSWGVVAAIVAVTPNDVSAALAELLSPGGTVLVAGPGAAGPDGAVAVPGGPGLFPVPLASAAAAPTAPTPSPGTDPPGVGTPPRPSPSSSPPPTTGVPVVDQVVEVVRDLASPRPSPSPTSPQLPVPPVPLPVPPVPLPVLPAPVPLVLTPLLALL